MQVSTPCKTAVAISKERQNFATANLQVYGAKPKKTYPPCCLCELLGDPMGNIHTHLLDFCFANPLSHKMISQVAWNRM